MTDASKQPKLVGLDGVELGSEDVGRSTIFHFSAHDGTVLTLDLITVLRLLLSAQNLGFLPPFDNDWLVRSMGSNGEAI